MTECAPTFVYAYAMSGPMHWKSHHFQYTAEAITYVLALAEDVRSRGVRALGAWRE